MNDHFSGRAGSPGLVTIIMPIHCLLEVFVAVLKGKGRVHLKSVGGRGAIKMSPIPGFLRQFTFIDMLVNRC